MEPREDIFQNDLRKGVAVEYFPGETSVAPDFTGTPIFNGENMLAKKKNEAEKDVPIR